jgi:hypothetical protein
MCVSACVCACAGFLGRVDRMTTVTTSSTNGTACYSCDYQHLSSNTNFDKEAGSSISISEEISSIVCKCLLSSYLNLISGSRRDNHDNHDLYKTSGSTCKLCRGLDGSSDPLPSLLRSELSCISLTRILRKSPLLSKQPNCRRPDSREKSIFLDTST